MGNFTKSIMTEWTLKPAVDKTYANTVTFFKEREAEIEAFESSSTNTTKQHGFASANLARKSAIVKLLE